MKTLIWDFNGTIVDDVEYCLSIEKDMLKRRGMPYNYTIEDYREMFCFPVIDYYVLLGYDFTKESYADLSVEFNAMYSENFLQCTLTDGFLDKITEAEKKGYRNIILSASHQELLIEQCRLLGIDHYFDEILGIDNNLAGSKIDLAKRWMKQSGTDPDECIYIGDTGHDLDTARAIGIRNIILAACGHESYRRLASQHDTVVHSLREVTL